MLEFDGVSLFTDFRQGRGAAVNSLPAKPGIYAEVYWPRRGLRIGETGVSIRGKIKHDIYWFKSMRDGTAPETELRRTIPIAEAAKATGPEGFEFYVVSADPRLDDLELRRYAERFLFTWAEKSDSGFVSWNHLRGWRRPDSQLLRGSTA